MDFLKVKKEEWDKLSIEEKRDVISKLDIDDIHDPSFYRKGSSITLNEKWDFIVSKNKDEESFWNKKEIDSINVPYGVESRYSNTKERYAIQPDDYMHYHRVISISKEKISEDQHVILHFEGVDQIMEAYINGKLVGTHVGGYTRIGFDITDSIVEGNNDLYVVVKDVTDSSYYMRGKQCTDPKSWFYHPVSGIYKSVWLEFVPKEHIESIKFTPLYDERSVEVFIKSTSGGIATLKCGDEKIDVETNKKVRFTPKAFHPWSVEDPYLYDCTVSFDDDLVDTYFAIRKIETKIVDGKPGIYLNDKRIFLNGTLDQGYYDHNDEYTPTSYRTYLSDVFEMKHLGFNTVRVHMKVESPNFYYWTDLLGLMVIQDFPCGGTKYKFWNVVFPRLSVKLFNKEKFITYERYGRESKEGRDLFINQGEGIIEDLYNHPSIVVWTIFNEAWGEFDPSSCYTHFKSYDPTRVYDTASGWLDTERSDIFSIHSYTIPKRRRKSPKKNRPYVLTEIGGVSYVPNLKKGEKVFGHGKAKTKASMEKKYKKLYDGLMPQIASGDLNGTIYTQWRDCESERNGLYGEYSLKMDDKLIQYVNKHIDEVVEQWNHTHSKE